MVADGSPRSTTLEADIREQAHALGFVQCGIARADAIPDAAPRLAAWLESGAHGSMEWMAARAHHRGSPAGLWPEVRSVIMLGMSYAPPRDPRDLAGAAHIGRIAAYAQGADYHDVMKKAVKHLARWLVDRTDRQVKVFVDTAPVMEKPLAEAAGLGWQGRHTNLVSREAGSWLLLGAIMTTGELTPDPPHDQRCGQCTACLTACPTNAFPAPFQLDARRCISYLTIEHKGPIPAEFREAIGNRIYGCDDCLAVCPWNKFAAVAQANQAFHPRAELTTPAIADILALDDPAFRQVFAGSPIKRIGRDRMIRNALIAAGNSGLATLVAQVVRLLNDPAPIVRGAAVWALGRLDPALLVRHAGDDPDEQVRQEWANALPCAG